MANERVEALHWQDPKHDYVGSSEVTPDIFNRLGENEQYLKDEQDKVKGTQQGVLSSLEEVAREQAIQDGRLDGLDTTTANLELNKIDTDDVQNAQVAITQATTRTNLGTKESVKSVFGKIKKWFADLNALAFKDKVVESDIDGTISTSKISGLHDVATSGEYADLENKPEISKSAIGLGNVANERQYSANNTPPYPVTKVANKTGNVTVTKSDVGLSSVDNVRQYSSSNPPPYPVTQVQGRTGKVVVTKDDLELENVANERQYSSANPPPYPVTKVNNKTGAVSLAKGDVGLGNVANERQYSSANPPPYPVKSVNGYVGIIILSKEDIGLLNVDNVKQLPIAGGTMTGALILKGEQYDGNYGLDANNSDIIGVNSIKTKDNAESSGEGIRFYRDTTHTDDLVAQGGYLYFNPYQLANPNTLGHKVYHEGYKPPGGSGATTTVTARSGLGNYTNLDDVLNYISRVFTGSQTVSKIKANTFDTV